MLFAEPKDPYDDPDQPGEWAWRFGYFELVFNTTLKTLTLKRGPRYSTRDGKSCRICHGNGYLPWSMWSAEERDTDTTSVPCPVCPARRTWFDHVPLWPVVTIGRLRTWYDDRRRSRERHDDLWGTPGQDPGAPSASGENSNAWGASGGYSNEPPF